ncbi:MAG: hypothetical protein K2X82_12765 [Gemmataceae bacterium]|nr:hypothetical protein [Gemmataceae bacterium]
MVTLYVAGEPVGTLADAEKVIAENLARNYPVEFRDEAGEVVGRFLPVQKPGPAEPLVPWDPSITKEDLDRIAAGPGYTFDEVRKMLGWST